VNDATSFTTYRFAVAAVMVGGFSLAEASVQFVLVVTGGIVVGVLAAMVVAEVQKRLDDPSVQTTLSLLTPYITYLTAESVHVSGVLSVVVAGLWLGWRAPEILNSRMRLVSRSVWGMVGFILNGFIFILIGLELSEVIHNLSGRTLGEAVRLAILVVALIVVVRIVWLFAVTYIPRILSHRFRKRFPTPSWRHLTLMSWAGMRGVDSLAAALALPFVARDGSPFPQRGLIVFLTFSVILGTLVVQGLSLPPLIRWLNIKDDFSLEEEERMARLQANQAALAKITELAKSECYDQRVVKSVRSEYEDRILQLTAAESEEGKTKLSLFTPEYEELSKVGLGEERKMILQLRNKRVINDHVLRKIQRDIDLSEVRMQQNEGEFGL
jgi:Na+/H+ antiporter